MNKKRLAGAVVLFICLMLFLAPIAYAATPVPGVDVPIQTPEITGVAVSTNGSALITPVAGDENYDYNAHLRSNYNNIDEMNRNLVKNGVLKKEELDKYISDAKNGSVDAYENLKTLYKSYNDKTFTAIHNKEISGINESESMAAGDMYAQEDEASSQIIKADKPGWFEKSVAELFRSLASGVNSILSTCDATLDNLIYGRLIRYGTNFFCFELVKGNPYGIIGAYSYAMLRNFAFVGIAIMAGWIYVKAGWGSGNSEARKQFKDAAANTVIVVLLLIFMPRIIDSVIALKDIILHYFSSSFQNDLTGMFSANSKDGILLYYKETAEKSETLFDSLLYFAASCISIFFVFTYIMTAVSEMVLFIFFPFVVIMSYMDNKLIGQWTKQMIGDIMAPIIDGFLLMVPVLVRNLCVTDSGGNRIKGYLIAVGICYAVIPCRALIKSLMGISGGLRSELLGFGAMMAAGRMLGNVGRRMKDTVNGISESIQNSREDRNKADMYEELAAISGEGIKSKAGVLPELSSVKGKETEDTQGILSQQDINNDSDEDMENAALMSESSDADMPELDSVNANSDEELENEAGYGSPDDMANEQEIAAIEGEQPNETETVQGADDIAASSPLSQEEQDAINKNNILKNHANVNNFEKPEFKNAFNFAERAQMYRKKAHRDLVGGIGRSVGGMTGGMIGGAALATVAGGATMFAGASTNMMATMGAANIGVSVGSSAGTAAAMAGIEGIRNAGAAGSAVGTMFDDAKAVYRGDADYSKRQILKNGLDAYKLSRRNQTGLEFNPAETVPMPHNLNNFGNVRPNSKSIIPSPAEMAVREKADYGHQMFDIMKQEFPDASEQVAAMEGMYASPSDLAESVSQAMGEEPLNSYNDVWSALNFNENEYDTMQQLTDAFTTGAVNNLQEPWQQDLYDQINSEIERTVTNSGYFDDRIMEDPKQMESYRRMCANVVSRRVSAEIVNRSHVNKEGMTNTEMLRFTNTVKSLRDKIKSDFLDSL